MFETPAEIDALQAVLDRSIERAGPFLRSSFEMPEHSLSAQQLTNHLTGLPTIAMSTVTEKGEPRVAPIGALFVRGRFHIPTVASAARSRHLRKRPAVSVTYYEGIDLAVIIHGQAEFIEADNPAFAELDAELMREGDGSVLEWDAGGGLYIRINPDVIYTFARYPDRFPG